MQIDALTVSAQCCDQLVMHDLDDHLAGRDGFHHLDADRLLLHAFGKFARNVEGHVGLEQRTAHFAQRGVDIGFAQRAAPGKAVKNAA